MPNKTPDAVTSERRMAVRVSVNLPVLVETTPQPQPPLPGDLARVYERVECNPSALGKRIPGAIRDLSTNGAFIAGEPLPLLTRVGFRFELSDYGTVDVLGWSLWRRTDDCELERPDGPVQLPKGFGVLFEAIPLDARMAIHRLAEGN